MPAVLVAAGVLLCGLTGTAAATPSPSPSPESSASAPVTSSASPTTTPSPDGPVRWQLKAVKPHLDPRLEKAYARAQRDAARQGVYMSIRSGFRTRERQEAMFAYGVRLYGSRAAARRWVAPPDESYHVKGRALDIQPRAAAAWLERHQERYGLCRTFANEWWHFELNTSGKKCPAVISSAAARTP